jgi:hypothetical protein
MANDEDFVNSFEHQTELLRQLKKRVDEALARAEANLDSLQNGVPKEKIFGMPGAPLEE